jgi:hypothetical protein
MGQGDLHVAYLPDEKDLEYRTSQFMEAIRIALVVSTGGEIKF